MYPQPVAGRCGNSHAGRKAPRSSGRAVADRPPLCSFIMEYDVHTILDMLTLAATGWVMYMMYFKLKTTYQADKDTLLEAYIVCF